MNADFYDFADLDTAFVGLFTQYFLLNTELHA